MRSIVLSFIFSAAVCARVFAEAPGYVPESLDFEQSVDRAWRSNPHLLSAQQDIAIARIKVRQAKSLFYPNVNLNLNYVRHRNETLGITSPELGNVVLEAPLPNADGTRGNPLSQNVYQGRVGFRQTLWAGGRIDSTYELSRANLDRASSSQAALREEIKLQVARSFYTLLGLQEQERLYLSTLKSIDGLSNSFTVLSAKAELRRNLAALEKRLRETRYDYLESMGAELFTDVRVTGTLDIGAQEPVDLQRAITWAKQNRTELRAIQYQQEVDRLAVSLSLAERYPVFLLGGAYEIRNNEFPLEENNWNAVLSMNIPIFDGFANLARVRESRFRADQGRLRRVQLEDEIERDVRGAYEDFLFWTDELARREKETTAIRQNRGSVSSLDYHQWNLAAELGIVEAKVERRLASALLEKSIGPENGGRK